MGHEIPIKKNQASRSERPWRIAALLFCFGMLCIHIFAGMNSAGIVDFWRDMYWASQIATGKQYPLFGPPIYELIELGPWWFYLLAVPTWLTGGVTAAAVLIQVLAAMKYFLANHIGARCVDARFGFLFAVGFCIAGWSTVPMLFPSHPALVETMILLLALATLRCRENLSIANAVLFGLAAAGCIHAHPTAGTYVVAAGLFLLHRYRQRAIAPLAVAALIVVLSLLPPWLDSRPLGVDAMRPFEKYATQDIGVDFWTRIPNLAFALLFKGAWNGFLLNTPWKLGVVRAAWWIYSCCLVIGLAGFFALPDRRRFLRRAWLIALIAFLVQICVLILLRAKTTLWMVPSALPPLALMIAIGWYGWFQVEAATLRIASAVALAIYAMLGLASFDVFLRNIHRWRTLQHVNIYTDVTRWEEEFNTVDVPFIPVRELDRIAASLCAPSILHGRLAWGIEHTLAAPVTAACGYTPAIRFGGREGDGTHIEGLLKRAAIASGIAPDRTIAGMAFYEHVHPVAPALGDTPTALPRIQITPNTSTTGRAFHSYHFRAHSEDAVSLINRFAGVDGVTIRSIVANQRVAKRLYDDGASQIYGCDRCDAGSIVDWQIDLDAIEQNLDVTAFGPASEESKPITE